VNATVDAGFPQFLQKVRVEPELVDGKFAGWIVRGLNPPEFWAGVDLEPGDVVTQVNGKPIERETEAFAVFQGLKTARRLQVSALRQGMPHPLDYEIVDRPR
jgi:type II secretory pathway component PulC